MTQSPKRVEPYAGMRVKAIRCFLGDQAALPSETSLWVNRLKPLPLRLTTAISPFPQSFPSHKWLFAKTIRVSMRFPSWRNWLLALAAASELTVSAKTNAPTVGRNQVERQCSRPSMPSEESKRRCDHGL